MRRITVLFLRAAVANRAGAVERVLHNGQLWSGGDPAQPPATALAIDQGRIIAWAKTPTSTTSLLTVIDGQIAWQDPTL
jgi:predicted amidohydrolase YtcJ